MPVVGKQSVNLKPVKKPAQRKEEPTSFAERTSLRSERSSMKSTTSASNIQTKTAAKTPPTKKKITQAQLDRAKRERERMAQQAQQQVFVEKILSETCTNAVRSIQRLTLLIKAIQFVCSLHSQF